MLLIVGTFFVALTISTSAQQTNIALISIVSGRPQASLIASPQPYFDTRGGYDLRDQPVERLDTASGSQRLKSRAEAHQGQRGKATREIRSETSRMPTAERSTNGCRQFGGLTPVCTH